MLNMLSVKKCLHTISARCISSSAPRLGLVNLSVDDKTGIATLEMNRPPVNSLNTPLLQDISSALTDVGKNKSKGLILTTVCINIRKKFLSKNQFLSIPSFVVFAKCIFRWIGYSGNVQTRAGKNQIILDNFTRSMAETVWFSVSNSSSN